MEHQRAALAPRQHRPVQGGHVLGTTLPDHYHSAFPVPPGSVVDRGVAGPAPPPPAGRGGPARERAADELGRLCLKLWHLDSELCTKRNLGERQVAGVVWLHVVAAAGTRLHSAKAAPRGS